MVKSALDLALSSDWKRQDVAVQTVADMLVATLIFAHMMGAGETENFVAAITAAQDKAKNVANRLVKEMLDEASK
jgi:hypothetical protein